MRRNRNGGNILKSSLKTLKGNIATYLLELESRDMILTFEAKPPDRFTSFGLKNAPVELLGRPEMLGATIRWRPRSTGPWTSRRGSISSTRAVGLSIGVIKDGMNFVYHYGGESKGEAGFRPRKLSTK